MPRKAGGTNAKTNYTIEQLETAIKGSGGIMSAIARRLNCDWLTADKKIREAGLRHLVDAEDESMNDLAEAKLMENIKNNDTTSIIFRLKTKAKHRGYVERQEYQVQAVQSFDDFISKINDNPEVISISDDKKLIENETQPSQTQD